MKKYGTLFCDDLERSMILISSISCHQIYVLRIYYPNFPVTTRITRNVEAKWINKHEAAIA